MELFHLLMLGRDNQIIVIAILILIVLRTRPVFIIDLIDAIRRAGSSPNDRPKKPRL
jgi:hypothetical protein